MARRSSNEFTFNKYECILHAAMRLFVEQGLHTVTVAQIAAAANVGIGTIYKHFKDKPDMVRQIWIGQKKHESEYVFRDYDPTRGSVRERFDFLWGRVIRYFIAHPLEYQFSYHFAASPILSADIHEVAMKDFLQFDAMFREGCEQGLFKPLSPRHLRLYTFSTINGWILWALDEKVAFTANTIELFLQMAWDAVVA